MANETIQTIARRAGVSIATVSKVLNGTGKISSRTSARILEIIKESNYIPQQRKQTGNAIAVLIFVYNNVSFANSFDANVLGGICKAAFQRNLDITLVNGEKVIQMSVPELHRYFLTNSLSGAILVSQTASEEFEKRLADSALPFVSIGSRLGPCSIETDTRSAIRSILDYMVCLGHKKIAYLGLITRKVEAHRKRFAAFSEFMQENNLDIPEEYIIELPNSQDATIRNALMRLTARRCPPDAIFFESEALAETVNILKELGINVPQDISVAGFYCKRPDTENSCSAIIQPTDHLGECAVETLCKITETPLTQKHELLPCQIVYGNTIRKI